MIYASFRSVALKMLLDLTDTCTISSCIGISDVVFSQQIQYSKELDNVYMCSIETLKIM